MSSLTSKMSSKDVEESIFWTSERTQKLEVFWAANRSQREIAALLGTSRSAISGKIRRMKLTRNGQQMPTIKPERPIKPKTKKKSPAPRPPPKKATTTLIISGPVSILDRKQFQCCTVLDGVKDKRGFAMMCGNRTHESSPWCKAHHELFYDPERGKQYGKVRHFD